MKILFFIGTITIIFLGCLTESEPPKKSQNYIELTVNKMKILSKGCAFGIEVLPDSLYIKIIYGEKNEYMQFELITNNINHDSLALNISNFSIKKILEDIGFWEIDYYANKTWAKTKILNNQKIIEGKIVLQTIVIQDSMDIQSINFRGPIINTMNWKKIRDTTNTIIGCEYN